jgi:hypothetical protein
MTELQKPTPAELLFRKDQILTQWQHLPPEHQATMALILLADVLGNSYGTWLLEALTLQRPDNVPMKVVRQPLSSELLDMATRRRLPLVFTPEGESPTSLAQTKFVLQTAIAPGIPRRLTARTCAFGLQVEYDITYDYFTLSDLQQLGNSQARVQRDPNIHAADPRRDRSLTPASITGTMKEHHGMDRERQTYPIR